MTRIIALAIVIMIVLIYVALTNKAFMRCPHCRKIGSWRFDAIDAVRETVDEQGELIATSQRQRCQSCENEVIHTWSDRGGRAIQKYSENAKQ